MAGSTNSDSGYETFEHTADTGLKVRGASLKELFDQAAAGFIDMMFDPGSVQPTSAMSIRAEGESCEELLVGWLQEILFAFDADRFAPAAARVESLRGTEVTGELRGEDFDPERHCVRRLVKAVTYHDLTISKVGDMYEVKIVFDV